MNTKRRDEFHPVMPNIIDDSMREVDKDVECVKLKNDKERFKTEEEPPSINADPDDPNPHTEFESSWGRRVMIGILIVIIVILVILLIYQIYKYYTADEIPLIGNKTPDPTKPPGIIHQQAPDNSQRPSPPDPCAQELKAGGEPIGSIPEHVRNLDDNVLNQFIKKNDNSTEQRTVADVKDQNSVRRVYHKSMLDSIPANTLERKPDSVDRREMERISQIIDSTQNNDLSNEIPSREEITALMQKDMNDDKRQSATLESIEEENHDHVLNMFDNDDDDEDEDEVASVKSDDGGCQFELTKGKNRGQLCGRKRVNNTRCARHRNK